MTRIQDSALNCGLRTFAMVVATISLGGGARGQNLQWISQLGAGGVNVSHGVSVDGLGNVYISGRTQGSLGDSGPYGPIGGYDTFIAKYDATGARQWIQQLGTSDVDVSLGISADAVGNTYITGRTRGSLGGPHAGGDDAFLAKYDAAGLLQWTRQLGTGNADISNGVSVDGLGNVYISGQTSGSLDGTNAGSLDAFVSKYDGAGTLEWTRQLGTSASDRSNGVSVDGAGNVYIAGYTFGDLDGPLTGLSDAFVSKYESDGSLLWTSQFGSSGVRVWTQGVSADSVGNVYITGYTNGSLGGPHAGAEDAFLAKFDTDGALQWTRQLGGSGRDESTSVVADDLGNVYISGWTTSSLVRPISGPLAFFVSKYDADGALHWTRQIGTSEGEQSFGIAADGLGSVYATGFTYGDLAGPASGTRDGFLAKFSASLETPTGDFNSDGSVDGADFTLWQMNFPNNTGLATLDMGDANGDGNIDGADFVLWQTNFPTLAGSAAPVPEPSAIFLATIAGLSPLAIARRHR